MSFAETPCIYGFLPGLSFNEGVFLEANKLGSKFESMYECAKEVLLNYPDAWAAQMQNPHGVDATPPFDCYAISAAVSRDDILIHSNSAFIICYLKGSRSFFTKVFAPQQAFI